MSIFECKALTKNYGAKTVLDSIDLTIEPGCSATRFLRNSDRIIEKK